MKNRIIYLLTCIIIGLISSCIQEDAYDNTQKYDEQSSVVFCATPKEFVKSIVGTKAEGEEEEAFDPTLFENTIYNAYFFLFDKNGTLRIKDKATVDPTGAVVHNIGRDVLSIYESFKIGFLANVPEAVYNDFVVNITTWSDLKNYYFDVTYATTEETGCVGVPAKVDLNGDGEGEYAMPMFQSRDFEAP